MATMRKNIVAGVVLVLAFLGIADAWYLAQTAYQGTALFCDFNSVVLDGCNIVAKSPYGHLFGIPLGVYGVFFYAVLFVLAALYLFLPRRSVAVLLTIFGVLGLAAGALFIGIQVLLIKALCIYCLGSAAIDVFIFISVLLFWRKERATPEASPVIEPWDAPVLP